MPEKHAIPITVGIVGHLDVVATEDHRQMITKLFTDLAKRYPNSPVYLFSSIAEGADRFVARIFLDLKRSDADYADRFSLIVPTPFRPEEYKKDFNEQSAKEFDELMKQAARTFCISCEEYPNDRTLQYLRTGKFIADSSIILIAMWDGEKGKKGGTADIVRHKIAGDDDNVAESTFEYDGTVLIMPSGRAGSDSGGEDPEKAVPVTFEQVLADEAIREALEKIEEINTQSVSMDLQAMKRSRSFLFNRMEELDDIQNQLLEWYSVFDIFSLRFRKHDIKISVLLFSIGFFLIVSLQVYSNVIQTTKALSLVMLFFVIATIIYLYSRNRNSHKKYLYNRTLAEALRIQFYWNIAGIARNVSEYFLRIHRKDFTWAKHILSAIFGLTYNSKPITAGKIKDLIDNWIQNQSGFFKKSIERMTKQMTFFNRISNVSFILAFLLLISGFFFDAFYKVHFDYLNLMQVFAGTFLGVFALIKGYLQIRGYEQLINQYELMMVLYDRAESKIIETDTYGLAADQRNAYLKELFFVIGKEALIENGNWYLLFKEKEPVIEGI
jgi:hypothetical protein